MDGPNTTDWFATGPTYLSDTLKSFEPRGVANTTSEWKSPVTIALVGMPAHGRAASALGARSNHNSDGPFAVTSSVKISRSSPPPPVIVAVAVAGTNEGPLKSTVDGSEPPSGIFRLRRRISLSGGVPALCIRLPTKSTGP